MVCKDLSLIGMRVDKGNNNNPRGSTSTTCHHIKKENYANKMIQSNVHSRVMTGKIAGKRDISSIFSPVTTKTTNFINERFHAFCFVCMSEYA